MPRTRVAVLVGTALNPTRERRPPNLPGIAIRTLWGEIGAQLAEQAGDRKLTTMCETRTERAYRPVPTRA